MDSNEIKDICLLGSKIYYKYLENKPNGGVEEVGINQIERINDNTFKFIIDRKLFEPDSVCFLYNGKYKSYYTSDKIKIKVYDNDRRVLIIKVSPEIIPILSDLENKNWRIIIDLKFLVQRVIDWYELNGNKLKFNPGKRKNDDFDISTLLANSEPSDEQITAIKTVFSENFCYIWGAPGTGKTRFVLSFSLLHYINKNEKVLVLAPTNVALEQVLSGVLEVLDQFGISHNIILRLGFPSKEFADKYGDICEIQGLEKELKRLSEQINIISSILHLKTDAEIDLESNLNFVKQTIELENQATNLRESIILNKTRKSNAEAEIELLRNKQKTYSIEKNLLIKKKNAVVSKIFKFMLKQIDYDFKINEIITKEVELENEIIIKQILFDQCSNEEVIASDRFSNIQSNLIENLHHLVDLEIICEPKSSLLSDALKYIFEQLQLEIENKQVFKSLSKEYSKYSNHELIEMLEQLRIDKTNLENYSQDTRIGSSQVIGATLDTFLFRFKEKDLRVSHIFIDEAGYASIVKALTVFTYNVPITFLGDHLQLQPVCELSKSDILKHKEFEDVFVWEQSGIFIGELWNSINKQAAINYYLTNKNPSKENLPRSSLTYSYRFGPNLAKTLSQYVYLSDGFRSRKKEDTELIICNVLNPQYACGKGRLNEAEAQCIKKYISENHKTGDSLAILAPYRDQIARLKKLLPDLRDENLILTVHKSQGREWDTVLYSVCDIGNGRSPWFTDTQNTLSNGINNVNTAVSRAKHKLVIFCNKSEWIDQNNQLISGLIKACTSEINYDFNDIQMELDHKSDNTLYVQEKNINREDLSNTRIKDMHYIPSDPDEQWESKTLFWSKKKKEGYIYSSKKDAWWKKK